VEKLFGIEMATIAGVLSAMLFLLLMILGLLAWRHRIFFKLGVRPIPRRPAQSILIVFGLMLATLIITAAFITGDTLSHSISTIAMEGMGEIDEMVVVSTGRTESRYFRLARYETLAAQLVGYPLIDHFIPAINESAPTVDTTRRSSLRSVQIIGLRPQDVAVLPQGEITNSAGTLLSLDELGENEVYLNAAAADALGAAPGDRLELYVGSHPKDFIVADISWQGEEPRMLVDLHQAQRMFNQQAMINAIIVSNQGDAFGGIAHSQVVTSYLRGLLSDQQVAKRLYNFLARDPDVIETLKAAVKREEGNTREDLLTLINGLQAGNLSPSINSLMADADLSDRIQSILSEADWGNKPRRDRLSRLFNELSDLVVDDIKRDTLDMGELTASAFTTIFIVSGLFGITAGLILIFLIFVMLAAERKSEMGMARAVGAQRGRLVEMFVFEGTAYDLAAAIVGVAFGVVVGLIIALTIGQAFAGVGLTVKPSVSMRSLMVSFSLGMLVTFFTVLISANRVSHLNIVSAIRDLPDPPRPPNFMMDRLLAPFRAIVDGFRALFRLRLIHAVRHWLISVPGSILQLFWLGFSSGLFTLFLGLLLTQAGIQSTTGATYGLGVSFVIIGIALLLRNLLSPLFRWLSRRQSWNAANILNRIIFTIMGLTLTIFWSLPGSYFENQLGVPEMSGGPEMLFISGIMLVTGAVLVIMYNTDLILRFILLILGRSPRFAPVLRMAIAYPLSNRFRTGMTIAIFAVVTFSVIFMATLFKVNDILLNDTEQFTGGFDLRVDFSRSNPLDDLPRAVSRKPVLDRDDYTVIASLNTISVELKQGQSGQWEGYLIQAADPAYLENVDYEIGVKAEGYTSSAEIWEAIRTKPGLAVMDRLGVPSRTTTNIVIGGPSFSLEGVYLEDETMKPIVLDVRKPNSDDTFEVTIIGVLEQSAITGYGLITSKNTVEKGLNIALPAPTYYIRLKEGVDPDQTSALLESVFMKNGLESVDLIQELRDSMSINLIFQQLMLGFLTVGLVVGVAALGVISTRAVVERRQQIGMLRALGFQRKMVSWVFLIESSFVALLGIGLGVSLALIPASQLVSDMAVDIPGLTFQVPWKEIMIVSGLAYSMTVLTTWLPALQASRVRPAEALRYE
jgi:putative ABC transport system permease protein